ncbi:hypothetical protein [Methylobacterium sp. 37f]|uniref:hypothetical protein n=1 Tax=Methylobacterium sp. 37f TaxID=2817058 RepID=UPI001FFD9806|nr:hypothetical protein [Methylobacterium sp. 37f]MCK2054626.1 hypothetical protein [Methylobacterium sp. 37f]
MRRKSTPPADFDADWYANEYPDVATAIAAGHLAGAYQHYVMFGKDEGRKPNGADSDKAAAQFRAMRDVHGGEHYLTPGDLAVTRVSANRILLIGSCFLEPIAGHASDALDGTRDFWLANFHAKLPDAMPHPASDYGSSALLVLMGD